MGNGGDRPRGAVAIRTIAMPADTNPSGDIFGGWIMSQMDLAGGITARHLTRGRVATVAVTGMEFHRQVHVGDVLSVHAEIERVGTTSITVAIEAWVDRSGTDAPFRVTHGTFTYVAIDESGRKRKVPARA